MARTKRPTAKALTAKADALFSRIVRAPGRCLECGRSSDLQCAHGFSRRHRNTRWDERNGFALCKGCHLKYTLRPLEWDEWMQERMGLPTYYEVRARALSTDKVDMPAVLARLVVRAKELELT